MSLTTCIFRSRSACPLCSNPRGGRRSGIVSCPNRLPCRLSTRLKNPDPLHTRYKTIKRNSPRALEASCVCRQHFPATLGGKSLCFCSTMPLEQVRGCVGKVKRDPRMRTAATGTTSAYSYTVRKLYITSKSAAWHYERLSREC